MPQGYCKECRAHVTVRDGACLLGHSIDPSTIVAGSGRHRAARSRQLNHSQMVVSRGAIGVDVLQPEPAPRPSSLPPPRISRRKPEPRPGPLEPSKSLPDPTPGPVPEPWQRPLLGRRKMPMLELLGFSDPDEMLATSNSRAPSAPKTIPQAAKLAIDEPTELIETLQLPGPRLADVHTGEHTENTGVLVARLWEATSTHELLGDDWEPSTTVEAPQRTFRWSFISAGLAVLVTVALLAVAAYRLPINQASALRDNLTGSYTSLDAVTKEIPAVANLVLDPGATSTQLAEAALPLLVLSDAANVAYASATTDPGTALPFVSKAPLDALQPAESSLQRAADEALVIHQRIGDVLDYRILLGRALVLPASLPVEASDAQISEIGVELSGTLAETTEVLLQLPQDDILAGHQLQLEKAFAEMNTHVADYLAALRSQNAFAASRIAGEMRTSSASVSESVEGTLGVFQAWLDGAFEQLEQQLASTGSTLQASGS